MEQDQLENLYIEYYRELYLYAFSLCKDYYLAQDLASDTFYKAILSLDDNVSYIKYWLFRVCKNLFIDYKRKDKEFNDTDRLNDIPSLEDNPLDKLIGSEENKEIYQLVMGLQTSFREVIILYYYCGFSISEISKTTGFTESNTKVLLFRARKRLRSQLEGGK